MKPTVIAGVALVIIVGVALAWWMNQTSADDATLAPTSSGSTGELSAMPVATRATPMVIRPFTGSTKPAARTTDNNVIAAALRRAPTIRRG